MLLCINCSRGIHQTRLAALILTLSSIIFTRCRFCILNLEDVLLLTISKLERKKASTHHHPPRIFLYLVLKFAAPGGLGRGGGRAPIKSGGCSASPLISLIASPSPTHPTCSFIFQRAARDSHGRTWRSSVPVRAMLSAMLKARTPRGGSLGGLRVPKSCCSPRP